ncbi:PLC-like phosphodiesterase [Morchella snyderi]|nr:PLC-like phosphodiesterase [Morchella snyderi]
MKLSLSAATAMIVVGAAVPTVMARSNLGIQDVLDSWDSSPYSSYPTQFTRDIIPKKLHSHNDYWRKAPLFTAIANGAISVEADVWLYNDTLYVGHDTSSLTKNRTFSSLYINPLLEILTLQNPETPFVTSPTRNGVYDASVYQTLFLFVDLKTDGATTWPAVLKALHPLRARNYLTTVNDTTITPGPITIIGTGGTPLDQIRGKSARDYFYDGPLTELDAKNITRAVSPIASTALTAAVGAVNGTGLSDEQKAKVEKQVREAHEKGIWVRYWDLPSWPVSLRNGVWRDLVAVGVDLLNVDDLEAAAGMKEVW